jgi:hypothetical protein
LWLSNRYQQKNTTSYLSLQDIKKTVIDILEAEEIIQPQKLAKFLEIGCLFFLVTLK